MILQWFDFEAIFRLIIKTDHEPSVTQVNPSTVQ